jgi:uncharacterized membrane protein
MGKVTTTTVIDAPVQTVFDYVSDYRNAKKYAKDLKKWEPVGANTDDIGAQFDAALQLGPKSFESRVEIDDRSDPQSFGWKTLSGFEQAGRYTFETEGSQTKVTFDFDYKLPGGMAGRLLARTTEPLLKSSLNNNLKTLKQQVEQLAADPS